MISLKQHYQSVKGNKKFIGGTIGFAIGTASIISTIYYSSVYEPEPKQTGNYARVVEIEKELDRNLLLSDVDSGLVNRVEALRAELKKLEEIPEVRDAKKNYQNSKELAMKFRFASIGSFVIAYMSLFQLILGNSERRRKLKELIGEDSKEKR